MFKMWYFIYWPKVQYRYTNLSPTNFVFFEASPEVMQEDQEERFLDRKQKESQRAFGVLMS